MIRQIKFNDGHIYGLIESATSYIITTDDLIHGIYKTDDVAELETESVWSGPDEKGMRQYKGYKTENFTLAQLREKAQTVSVSDFVNYWGIKDRIRRNYGLLLKSMREIGLDTKTMPKWGD